MLVYPLRAVSIQNVLLIMEVRPAHAYQITKAFHHTADLNALPIPIVQIDLHVSMRSVPIRV